MVEEGSIISIDQSIAIEGSFVSNVSADASLVFHDSSLVSKQSSLTTESVVNRDSIASTTTKKVQHWQKVAPELK